MVQTIATVVVALLGIAGTLMAGLLTRRQERADEQRRWARDQRVAIYVNVMRAYLDAFLSLSDQRAITREMASLRSEMTATTARYRQLQAASAGRTGDVDQGELRTAIGDYEERIAKLDDQSAIQEERRADHATRFQDQTAVLSLVGSETVQALAVEVRDEITRLLAATVDPEAADVTRMSGKWALLQSAMRRELAVVD